MKYTGKNPNDPNDRSNWTLNNGSPLSDEQWGQFQKWHQAGAPSRMPAPGAADPEKPSIFQGPADAAGAAMGGAFKELFDPRDNPSTFAPNPNPSPLAKWAGSDDPNHPVAEKLGRIGADVAPTMMLPNIGIASLANKLAKTAPFAAESIAKIAPYAYRIANATAKGAVGGAMQPTGDRGRAAETGAGTAFTTTLGRVAWDLLPPNAKKGVIAAGISGPALGALAAALMSQRGREQYFWPLIHASHAAIPAVGATVAGAAGAPGVAGALGAQTENWADPSPTGWSVTPNQPQQ